jgi:hypothetical protein
MFNLQIDVPQSVTFVMAMQRHHAMHPGLKRQTNRINVVDILLNYTQEYRKNMINIEIYMYVIQFRNRKVVFLLTSSVLRAALSQCCVMPAKFLPAWTAIVRIHMKHEMTQGINITSLRDAQKQYNIQYGWIFPLTAYCRGLYLSCMLYLQWYLSFCHSSCFKLIDRLHFFVWRCLL